jgi:hypothetical protein
VCGTVSAVSAVYLVNRCVIVGHFLWMVAVDRRDPRIPAGRLLSRPLLEHNPNLLGRAMSWDRLNSPEATYATSTSSASRANV